MAGWVAAGTILAVACFSSRNRHVQHVPLIGAVTGAAAAAVWTFKLFNKNSSEGVSPSTKVKGLEGDHHNHALELPSESDDKVCVLAQNSKSLSDGVQLVTTRENSSTGYNKNMVSHIVREEPSDALPNKTDTVTMLDQSICTPIAMSPDCNPEEAGEIGYPLISEKCQLEYEFSNLDDDEFNRESSYEQFVAPMVVSAVVENMEQDENADPSSVWKFLDPDHVNNEVYTKDDNSTNVLPLISKPSIEEEDASTVSGATCSSKSSLTSPTLLIINPSTLEGITLNTQVCPWAEEGSADHEVLMPLPDTDFGGHISLANPTEMKDRQLSATSTNLVSFTNLLTSHDHTTPEPFLAETSPLPCVEHRAEDIGEAPIVSETPLAIEASSSTKNADLICIQSEVATQLTVSSVPAFYSDLLPGHISTSQDGSKDAHANTLPAPTISTSSFSSIAHEAKFLGEEDSIVSTISLSDHREDGIITEGKPLDLDHSELADALDTSEKPLTDSMGNTHESVFEESAVQDLYFEYGVKGDADIFDILTSPVYSAAPEKSSILDGLDHGGAYSLWPTNIQVSKQRAASTSSSVKNLIRQEAFTDPLSFSSDVSVDPLHALAQRPTSAASFASGEDIIADTISFKTAQSFESSQSNSISHGKMIVAAAERPRWLAASGEGGPAIPLPSGSILTPAKILPTLSHSPSRLGTDFHVVGASNFTEAAQTQNFSTDGAGDTLKFSSNRSNNGAVADAMDTSARRPYSDRAKTYDQYLSDPRLPLQMRHQVMRAKATLEKYYETKKVVD